MTTATRGITMCMPGRREDLPAYARTGQLHSGHPLAEIQSRCIDLLYAVHGSDHDEHEEFNEFLDNTGHPAATGELTIIQTRRVALIAQKYQAKGDVDTYNCAELLLNAAGLLFVQVETTVMVIKYIR